MYRNVFLIVLLSGILIARLVGGSPLPPATGDNTANYFVPVGIIPTSSASSTVTHVSIRITSIPTPATVHSKTSDTFTSPASSTNHSLSGTQPLPAIRTTLPQATSTASPAPPLTSTLIPNSSPQTPSSPSPSQNLPLTSSFRPELSTSISLLSSALPSSSSTVSTNIAPTVRHVLIALLAGIPTLMVLAYLITLRWRRAHRARGYSDPKILSDNTGVDPSGFRERKSARLSSFFGVSHGNGVQEKDGKKGKRELYATSIHSSAGLAGVGAHRGVHDNGVPPMITYVRLPESRKRADTDSKANFENPFGTPPPVHGGFVIAPSRVSPHIPQTPPLHLVQLPSAALRNESQDGRNMEWTRIQSLKTPNETRSDRQPAGSQPIPQHQGGPSQQAKPPPPHVRSGRVPSALSYSFLSPNPPATAHMYRQFPPLDIPHRSGASRASAALSVYGGIDSPHIPQALAKHNVSPVLPYLVHSPMAAQTPVLPYLTSPALSPQQAQEQQYTMGPVIVIETASTIDSMSEYDDDGMTASDDETRISMRKVPEEVCAASVAQGPTRRDGLIGSPYGYVPPSTTFSTASSYSSSSLSGAALSTASSIDHHGSGPSMSASSSDDSSITVRATTVPTRQLRIADGEEKTPHAGGFSWLPETFDELERGGMLKA